MSRLIPLFFARERQALFCFPLCCCALFCFAFFLLCSPADSWAQDNSVRPTDGKELRMGEQAWGRLVGAERAPGQDREMQYWALDAPAGETASVRLESDDFRARLYVLGFGLRESISDRDDVASTNVELTVTFPETGTYYVAIEAYGSRPTGSYSLVVTEAIGLATLSTGGRVLRGRANVTGMLTEADPIVKGQPVQAWAFEARAGIVTTIELLSDDFDTYLFVTGPGLPEPLSDDDGGAGLNSRLEVSFPSDGEYLLIASSVFGGRGLYTLRVR